MLDFRAVHDKEITFKELTRALTLDDLRRLTNEMIDAELELIRNCTDDDVTFVPQDPEANDPYAQDSGETAVAWTLGHVIVHGTASSEEAAFLAAEMARGVELHGRSRYETPWQSVSTIAQCRQRLAESRRIRLVSLDLWPDAPHMEIFFQWSADKPSYNAVGRFVLGLRHEDSHLAQIAVIVRQAQVERVAVPA